MKTITAILAFALFAGCGDMSTTIPTSGQQTAPPPPAAAPAPGSTDCAAYDAVWACSRPAACCVGYWYSYCSQTNCY